MINSYNYFNNGGGMPNVDIPWGDYWNSISDAINILIDLAAQQAAVELTNRHIGPVAGSALKKVNALLGIFDPFPNPAEAPTLSDIKDDVPCK